MFVYSLAGLTVDGGALPEIELPDNETTARTGVYQLLARLIGHPCEDVFCTALAGDWAQRLHEAGSRLPFAFDPGAQPGLDEATPEDFEAGYISLFEVGRPGGPPTAPLAAGAYGNGRMERLEEVTRFYEYFGLSTAGDDPRPADHLATELEFMKYLTFKEAVSTSQRLQGSYRRAQHDFLERQLLPWVPALAERVSEEDGAFWGWATQTIRDFIQADAKYAAAVLAS